MTMKQFLNFIGGAFVATGNTFDNRAPVDNRVIGQVHEAGQAEVDAAVRAARAALKGDWGRMSVARRVELLYAVRATIAERQLVAEPFLLVGVIASIKEIVVVSVKAADLIGEPEFTDAVWQIGVLGVLVLALGLTAWLLRLKEREPDETDDDDPVGGPAHHVKENG